MPTYNGPVTIGPGPTQPVSNFGAGWTYEFPVPAGSYVQLKPAFHAAWINVIFLYDTGTHLVLHEWSTSIGGDITMYETGQGLHEPLSLGLIAFHKYNIGPDHEGADDPYYQSPMALCAPEGGNIMNIGWKDSNGPANNNAEMFVTTVKTY